MLLKDNTTLVCFFYWQGVRLIQQSSVVQLQSHHRNKPDIRPVSLCVCLEVEAEGRLGFPVEGVGQGSNLITRIYHCFFLKIFQKWGSLVPMRIMVLIVGQTLSDLSGLK